MLTLKTQVTWRNWADDQPPEAGTYLTYWSDGTLETYPLDENELERAVVMVHNAALTHWADLPPAPKVEG